MKRLLFYLFATFLLLSCEIAGTESSDVTEPTQEEFIPALSINTYKKTVDSSQSSFEINVTANIAWTTSGTLDWVTLTPDSGNGDQTIVVEYEGNTLIEKRYATIKFQATDYDNEIGFVITQAAFEPMLSISSTSKDVAMNATSFDLRVFSNVAWSTSDIPDWITLTSSSGSGDQSIVVECKANTIAAKRDATIKFQATDYDNETEIVITQAAFESTGNTQLEDLNQEEL